MHRWPGVAQKKEPPGENRATALTQVWLFLAENNREKSMNVLYFQAN